MYLEKDRAHGCFCTKFSKKWSFLGTCVQGSTMTSVNAIRSNELSDADKWSSLFLIDNIFQVWTRSNFFGNTPLSFRCSGVNAANAANDANAANILTKRG